MPARNGDVAPLAGGKRSRSLFRRLFYREDPFALLDATELAAIFAAFACVVRLHPVILYWVHQLGDQEYLVSDFRHRSMAKYSGLEVVHVMANQIGYYRLPGAKAAGRGSTEPGVHAISVQAPGKKQHRLRIRKCELGQLHVDTHPVFHAGCFVPLQWHVLDRSKFADEMRTIVERGIEWDYQRELLGEPDRLRGADWIELIEKSTGLSKKIDSMLKACVDLRKARP